MEDLSDSLLAVYTSKGIFIHLKKKNSLKVFKMINLENNNNNNNRIALLGFALEESR